MTIVFYIFFFLTEPPHCDHLHDCRLIQRGFINDDGLDHNFEGCRVSMLACDVDDIKAEEKQLQKRIIMFVVSRAEG